MADKETIILDFQVEQGDAISELEKTKISILNLKKEQQDLNKAYKSSQITVEEFASESVRLEGILKKQTNQYNTTQKAVTGVKTQFDKLVQANQEISKSMQNSSASLAKIIPGFSNMTQGIESTTQASKAFISTPIGAVIGALGIAVAALTRFFRDNEDGQNKFNQLMNIAAAITGKLTDAISKLGGFIFDKLIKGFEFLTDTLSKYIPGFDEFLKKTREFLNLDRADLISNLQAETDILERQLIVQKAQLEAKVAENKLRAEDKSLDLKARLSALNEASKAQKELNDLELKFAENKFKIIQETNKQSNSNKEALKQEAEAEAELFRIRKDAADKQKEIFTKGQELRGLEKAEIDKYNLAITEELRLKKELEQVNERLNNQAEKEIINLQPQIKGKIDLNAANRAVETANKNAVKAQKEAAFADQVRVQSLNTLTGSLMQAGSMSKELAIAGLIAQRATAISQIVSNTGIANAKATAASPLTAGQPWVGINTVSAGISIATLIATAIKQFGDITRAAGGGHFLTKGPQLLMVGDNPGGVERVTVEPVSGRGQTIVGNNMIKLAGGGIVETQSSTSSARSNFAFANSMNKQIKIFTSLTELREANNRIDFKEKLITV